MANYGWPSTGAYDPYNPANNMYGYGNPYNPNYTSRYTPAPAVPQIFQNIPQNTVQPQTNNSNMPWIQVPNIEAARNVMVQPNQTAYMMNQNAPEFYVKNTDAMGVATLRCFKFAEFNPTEEAAKEVLSSQAGNLVSREEFNNFAQAVSAQFNAIQQGLVAPSNMQSAPPQPVLTPLLPEQKEVASAKTVPATKKKEATT